MIADLNTLPAHPDEPWDIARGILPAQATWCFRHALELDQTEQTALSSLVRALESRGMFAAAREVAAPRNSVNQQVTDGELIIPKNEGRDDVMVRLSELVEQGRGAAATRCFAEAENRGIVFDWAAGNRLATARLADWLSHGRPAGLGTPPGTRRRLLCAGAGLPPRHWRRKNSGRLERGTKRHSNSIPRLGEAWFGLALLHTQLGEAAETLAACDGGLRRIPHRGSGRGAEDYPGCRPAAAGGIFDRMRQPTVSTRAAGTMARKLTLDLP